MCQDEKGLEVKRYLVDRIRQAEWVKQCVAQRNTTLLSVVKEIVKYQESIFYGGADRLKPLRMVDIAELLKK